MSRYPEGTAEAFQWLARWQIVRNILKDIAADMVVCRLEGWDAFELPRMIKTEIDRIMEKAG